MRRMLPPLTSLRAFEAAARHMSFQAAAAELGVTPTAISHQIRELEEACGCPLFRRRPRPLTLTEAGESLFPVLRAGLDAFAAAVAALHEPSLVQNNHRPLRVTTTNAFAHLWLVPRLALWRAAQPVLRLELIGTDAALDLEAGEADLAIRYAHVPPPGLVAREVFRDSFWPMASPSLLARGEPIQGPDDLLQHTLIHMDWGADARAPTWQRWFSMAHRLQLGVPELRCAHELRFREELHAMEAAAAGQGVAICSDVLAARDLRAGRLVRAHDLSLPGLGFYLSHLQDHPRQAAIKAFSEWIRSVAEEAGGL